MTRPIDGDPLDPLDPLGLYHYRLPEGEQFEVTVPPDLAVEFYGGLRGADNQITFSVPPVQVPAADLVFGRYRLGRFAVDNIRGSVDRFHTHYIAGFRRMEDPPPGGTGPHRHTPRRDDDVAKWIKAARDASATGPEDDAWHVLDTLLDNYREHADTGTFLDEDSSPTAPGEE